MLYIFISHLLMITGSSTIQFNNFPLTLQYKLQNVKIASGGK